MKKSFGVLTMEWAPKSGKMMDIPEVDQAAWFTLEESRLRINERQIPLLEELNDKVQKAQLR